VTMLKYSCPVADVRVYNSVLRREYSECDTWRRNALDRVNAMRPAAVFIGQYPRAQFTYDANGARIRLDPVRWEAAQRVVLEQFASMHVPTVLFRDSPTMTHRIPECLSRAAEAGRPPSVCAADRGRALDTRFLQADERAARGLSSVALVDLSDALCGPAVCDAVRDGLVVYRDGNHLTATYARHLAPMLDQHLAQVLPRLGFVQPDS